MRSRISYMALGVALLAGESAAHAQTVVTREITDQPVETVITQQPGSMVIAQQPVGTVPPAAVIVTQPAPAIQTVPVESVETVRTVRSTTTPRPRIVSRRVARTRTGDRVTTTQTIVREGVVSPPAVIAAPVASPAVEAIAPPTYTAVVQPPVVSASTYPVPLYDVVPAPVVAAQPVIGTSVVTPVPAYRYVYEPDRILVIDANTGIAVQALPR